MPERNIPVECEISYSGGTYQNFKLEILNGDYQFNTLIVNRNLIPEIMERLYQISTTNQKMEIKRRLK